MWEENSFVLNGRFILKDKGYANAHLSYKGYSIIIDYEHCLHYYTDLPEGKVPVEVYPIEGDIDVFYVSLDPVFNKADIAEIIEHINTYKD